MDRNNALTDPKKLIRVELKNAGFDIDKIKIIYITKTEPFSTYIKT